MAASAHSAADRAPAEVALLGVCCAVLIGAAAVVIRRSRALRRRPSSAPHDVVPRTGEAGAEPITTVCGPDGTGPYPVPQYPDAVPGMRTARAHRVHGADNPARVTARAWAAAAIVLAIGTATAVLMVHGNGAPDNGPVGSRNVVAAISPAAVQDPATTAPAATSPAGSPAASPSGSRSSAAPGHKPSSPATTAPSTPAPAQPPAGTLSGPASVEMVALEQGVTYTAEFTITAEAGQVTYSASEPASEDSDYSISITSAGTGTLQAGQEQTVTATVTVLDRVSDPYVSLSPGGAAVTFVFPPVRVITTCPADSQLESIKADMPDEAIPCP